MPLRRRPLEGVVVPLKRRVCALKSAPLCRRGCALIEEEVGTQWTV